MIQPLNPAELSSLLEKGDDSVESPSGKVHVFDLRGAEAFAAGHVPGARHTPHSQALRWIPQRALTQELVVLVDDDGRAGGPARHVAHELAHHWFRRLRYLEGGYAGWKQAGLQEEKDGPTGAAAGSYDGTTRAFQTSGEVPWRTSEKPGTPDPTRVSKS